MKSVYKIGGMPLLLNMRQDIQALRGYAILIVLLYHSRLDFLHGGYLGVDIFFVISGFLITTMVTSQIQRGSFSFGEFYFRRAKRLIPAAYTTLLVTALLSMWLLTSQEFKQFTQQLWGAVTFTSNIVLWRQGSYFGGEAELKPLLHTWSLAIEEQYYLLLPAALFFIPPRHWFKVVLLVLLTSGALCIGVMYWRPDVAFYLFPTRAWELAIGSLGVFLMRLPQTESWARRLFWLALLLILSLPVYPLSNKHPGIDALLVGLATLVLILAKHPWLNHGKIVGVLARLGDWSYSLYLVHWPIFALASNVWIGDLPVWVKWCGVALSIALAWLQYKFIENPIHHSSITRSWPRAGMVALGSGVLMLVPFLFLINPAARQEYSEVRRGNTGLSPACAFRGQFQPFAECQSASKPTTLVWGDSYAMHAIPGIKNELGSEGLIQATKYVCGPLLGVAPIAHATGATQNRKWSEECMAFNDSVLDYLKSTPSIHTVVLASMIKQYMTPDIFHNLVRKGDTLLEETGSVDIAMQGLNDTVKAIRSLGKKVVFIAPPPAMDWDAGRCVERILRGLPTLGPDADCVTKEFYYQSKRANVLSFMRQLPDRVGVEVISFEDVLRSGNGYMPTMEGQILFIANGHLSYQGSEILAKKMHLGEKIVDLAK
jgi:peptidoglycan/LPS O-acetylase OafA/YrhL